MVGENVIYTMRNKLYKYIQHANISFHDKTPSGTLFVRITSYVEDITTFFKEVLTTFVKDVLMIVAFAGMMIFFNYKLSLICFILIPLVAITSYIINRINIKVEEYSKKVKTELNIFLSESIYGANIIKIFNRHYEKNKECERLCEEFKNSRFGSAYVETFLIGLMRIFENLGISLIVWTCVNHFFGINLEVGVIYIFTTYLKQIFEPVQRIIENFEVVQEALVSINKIYDILDHKEYLEDFESGIELEKVEGKIEFKNVWFAYEGENWILKNVSFSVEPRRKCSFCTEGQALGKTTIINLINRFYEIQKGEILLDGVNIKDINLRSLRKKIGIVLQDPFIFANTIKKNIELSDSLSDEGTKRAIKLATADEFVDSLPNGIEEVASERGSSFSAGQKQLIAFARIFAHDPAIFVLDEATANIDTKTEEIIQKSVDKISKDKTSIFIAHRLSTIVNVDKIIVLNQGEIVEEGSHSELMNNLERILL